jgi:hypothetical protein
MGMQLFRCNGLTVRTEILLASVGKLAKGDEAIPQEGSQGRRK